MAKLSRIIDPNTKAPKILPVEPGYYKLQVGEPKEWGSNKAMGISGVMDDLSQIEQDQVTVISLMWPLKIVDDPRYDGTSGARPRELRYWTTYWADEDYINEKLEERIQRYLVENPTATEEEAKEMFSAWNPQTALWEFLWACGLMERQEEKESYEYVPLGWQMNPDGISEAINAAVNSIVYGKIEIGDNNRNVITSIAPMEEK